MEMSDKRRAYLAKYRAERAKRIPLDVKPQFYIEIKAAADADGMTVNGLIRKAVGLYLAKKR